MEENGRDYPHKRERISPPSAMIWLDKTGHVDRVQHHLTNSFNFFIFSQSTLTVIS